MKSKAWCIDGHSITDIQGATLEDRQFILCTAASRGDYDTVKNLLFFVKPGIHPRIDPNHKESEYNGRTAITLAAASDHLDIVKLLYSNGADPNVRSFHGYTAVLDARGKSLEYLLQHRAKIAYNRDHPRDRDLALKVLGHGKQQEYYTDMLYKLLNNKFIGPEVFYYIIEPYYHDSTLDPVCSEIRKWLIADGYIY